MKLLVLGDLASVHMKRWTDYLGCDYEIYGFTFAETNVTSIPKSNVLFYSSNFHKKTWCITAVRQLLKFFRDVKPDVVHVHYASSYGLLASFLKTNKKVLSAWGSDVNYCQNSFLRRILMRYTLASYPVVNCASKALAARAVAISSHPRYEVFQYGIDINISVKRGQEKVSNPTFIINRGFLDIYRVDYVVREFDQYLSNGGKGTLLVYGYGSQKDESRVCGTINECKNKHSIFFKGKVKHSVLFDSMSNAQYYISIPTTDGAPLALYEAMHIGLYPIVSNIESNRETFSMGYAEFLHDDSVGSLTTIFSNLTRKDIDTKEVEINRRIVKESYNYQKNTSRMKDIYSDLAQR
ncbi:glycosyltransferase [Aliivibrio fischeri]|uniref:glycosyltransferase n=1 Tax=Aliivibrio fischeri TaxID=668 RepID=UPI0012DAD6D7|nr:glycosyltransferase [Aliivibrio fischeri]MUK39974.1 glycosyltransferase [Aliivibrio fischeri]